MNETGHKLKKIHTGVDAGIFFLRAHFVKSENYLFMFVKFILFCEKKFFCNQIWNSVTELRTKHLLIIMTNNFIINTHINEWDNRLNV